MLHNGAFLPRSHVTLHPHANFEARRLHRRSIHRRRRSIRHRQQQGLALKSIGGTRSLPPEKPPTNGRERALEAGKRLCFAESTLEHRQVAGIPGGRAATSRTLLSRTALCVPACQACACPALCGAAASPRVREARLSVPGGGGRWRRRALAISQGAFQGCQGAFQRTPSQASERASARKRSAVPTACKAV